MCVHSLAAIVPTNAVDLTVTVVHWVLSVAVDRIYCLCCITVLEDMH